MFTKLVYLPLISYLYFLIYLFFLSLQMIIYLIKKARCWLKIPIRLHSIVHLLFTKSCLNEVKYCLRYMFCTSELLKSLSFSIICPFIFFSYLLLVTTFPLIFLTLNLWIFR